MREQRLSLTVMIDTLQVFTAANGDGTFSTKWQWSRENSNGALLGGIINTKLNVPEKLDREILAELSAIHYLLEDRRLGTNNSIGHLKIKFSCGAIKKALAKGALKKGDIGKTDKAWVASWADFLATKYFEAQIEIARWVDPVLEISEEHNLEVFQKPTVPIFAKVLDSELLITRHSIYRFIGRILSPHGRDCENDLSDVPDARWTAAWKRLEKVFADNSRLKHAEIVDAEWKRIVAKFKCEPIFLSDWDTKAVFVIKKDRGRCYLLTVLRDDEYNETLKRPPVQFGDKLIDSRQAEAMKAKKKETADRKFSRSIP